MKLKGIIEQGLGGFTTIRGYADMADLVLVSKTEDFQRVLIPAHVAEIKEYYIRNKALFFPEIVLAYTLAYDFATGVSGTDPMRDILDKKVFESNLDGVRIKSLKIGPRGQQLVEVKIDDNWLKTEKPFSVIDGNHRLNAYLSEDTRKPYENYVTPFSIILFEDNEQSRKNKKLIFHNINSKARKLTTEEELKGIICNDDFTDKELEEDFGKEYLLVRKLSNAFPDDKLEDILGNLYSAFQAGSKEVVKNSVLYNLIRFLFKNKLIDEKTSLKNIKKAIQEVNNEFYNFTTLKKAKNSALLIAAVGIHLNSKVNLKPFANWLSQNHLSELNEIKAQSLYSIYLKLNDQSPRIFVAMPYFSKDEIESYNDTYQRVVTKINSENPDVNLKLYPIMVHEGGTKDIVVEMLNQINGCTIFIADITKANSNVAYELGYARSRDIKTIIVRRKNDRIKVPFDYEHLVKVPYNPLAHSTLEDAVYADVKAILIEKGYTFS